MSFKFRKRFFEKGRKNKFTLPIIEFCSCKCIIVILNIRKIIATVSGIKDA